MFDCVGSTEISENMPTVSVHPKSLFNFSRRHLFRVSPAQMAQDLQSVLSRLAVQTRPTGEPFTLECEILFPDWTRFTQPMVDATTTNSGFSGHSDSTHTQNSNEPHGPSTTATSATSATPASQTPIPVATSTSAPLNIQTREDSLHFTIMIYQARWAGGRLGVKVKEAEDEINGQRVYANLYHTILNELGQLTV
ncbi:hypothetical protein J3Q64DRAFT_1718983 [Phycomyces blakesleeanus]|uniref:Uncharacterized protein n=1 Tax=Phycomyces blakesleeanus TaxID=4837 RepID=A0ABR3B8Y6_PHYBL